MSNDRLKFRVWDKFLEKMSETFHIFDFETDEIGQLFVGGLKVMPFDAEVMQWTGLYDSEGEMIWEGDIVELRAQWGGFVGDIIFECGCFGVKDGHTVYTFQDTSSDTLRIIGNIHESPDLMERANG